MELSLKVRRRWWFARLEEYEGEREGGMEGGRELLAHCVIAALQTTIKSK